MKYYPVNLDIRNRKCLVVGGGAVGTRKALTLLACGASVTVIGSETTDQLTALFESRQITLKRRAYRPSDINGMFLVIGATDDEALNRNIHGNAKRLGILCNIADHPEICDFILPAVFNRGDLTITVSTAGQSPALAKQLRLEMESRFGDEYAELLQIMGAIRRRLLKEREGSEDHKRTFERLLSGGLIELIKAGDKTAIDVLLKKVIGKDYHYGDLLEEGLQDR